MSTGPELALKSADIPGLQVLKTFHELIKVNGLGRVEVVLVEESLPGRLCIQTLIERVLDKYTIYVSSPYALLARLPASAQRTIDRMTTHGRFSLLTMALDRVLLPEPELPAMPIRETSAHGGE